MSSYGTDRRGLIPSGLNAGKSTSGDTPLAGSGDNLNSEIDQMLSALPEAPPNLEAAQLQETVADAAPPADLNSAFSQMLTSLPDGPEPDADFDLRPGFSATRQVAPQPTRPAPGRKASIHAVSVNSDPVGFGSVQTGAAAADSAPPRPAPSRPAPARPSPPEPGSGSRSGSSIPRYPTDAIDRSAAPARSRRELAVEPPANRFGKSEDEIADFLSSDEEVTPPEMTHRPPGSPGRRPGAHSPAARSSAAVGPDSHSNTADSGPLAQRILDELEKYSIAAVTQLRIAVHDGAVTIMGDVPGDYEKKLINHFSKKVQGVTEVVDMMRVVGGEGLTSGPEVPGAKLSAPKPKFRRPKGPGLQLSFPFQAKHVGIVAGLLMMIYAGYTFATRDGSKLSLNPVTGKVLFEGSPPEGATVVLHSLDEEVPVTPKGTVKADGTVQFSTYLPGDGVPAGNYKLTISWMQLVEVNGDLVAGPNQLPEFLSKPESTTFDVMVKSGKNDLPPIQITR